MLKFTYEITEDDYVACQLLHYEAKYGKKRNTQNALAWILLGIFLIVVAYNAQEVSWPTVLLAMSGAYWTFSGVNAMFLVRHFRRFYPGTKLQGKKFNAVIDEQGIEISSNVTYTKSKWSDVTVRSEGKDAFMLYSQESATLWMFGKKYLNDEQQREMVRLLESAPKAEQ